MNLLFLQLKIPTQNITILEAENLNAKVSNPWILKTQNKTL